MLEAIVRAFEVLRQLLVVCASVCFGKLCAWPMRARTKCIRLETREASAATAEQKGENMLLDLVGRCRIRKYRLTVLPAKGGEGCLATSHCRRRATCDRIRDPVEADELVKLRRGRGESTG
jgi:hypothetical protein